MNRQLLLILLVALGLRLVNLGERDLWYDEAFTILFADQGLGAMLYGTLTPVEGGTADIHPLLYYVTADGWMALFGNGVFAVRLWSVLLGVVTVGLTFIVGRALFDNATGLLAALITALAPFHVQYSQEARMYSLLALLLLAATWCYVRGNPTRRPPLPGKHRHFAGLGEGGAVRATRTLANTAQTSHEPGRRSWLWWVAFGVLAGLAMHTQQLAAFYLLALGLYPLLTRHWWLFVRVSAGAVIALIVYLPWLVNLPGQIAQTRVYWTAVPGPTQPLVTLRAFFVSAVDLAPTLGLLTLGGALLVIVFLFLQIGLRASRLRRDERTTLLFVVWLFVGPIALMWLVSQLQPVYVERGLIASALMLYLLLAWLFVRGGLPRPIRGVIALIALALAGVGLVVHYTWDTFPNSPYQRAATAIQADWQPGDVIVHQSKLSALPMRVYQPDLNQHYIADVPGSPEDTLAHATQTVIAFYADDCIQAAASGAERVWYVVYADALRQYEAAGRDDLRAAVDWLSEHYDPQDTRTFNDLTVHLYSNPDAAAQQTTDCAG